MKDSLFKTIAVAAGICLVCSVFVSITAVLLRPIQEQNSKLDKKKNILVAAGLVDPNKTPSAAEIESLFSERMIPVVVDLQTGSVLKDVDPGSVDPKKDVKSEELSRSIETKKDIAQIKRGPNRAVVYELLENGERKKLIFPIYGKGLWSTMYGFVALEPDLNTVSSINFYDHGETPGLGGEIANPRWQHGWTNKEIFQPGDITPQIDVVRAGGVDTANPQKAKHQVDGIAGATLTGRGVAGTVRFWLGENGFGPYIQQQKSAKN
ncbi:MAG: Na(+)-translocating NADH-quinone reductase subunit C [Thermoguttaceae bacterium]